MMNVKLFILRIICLLSHTCFHLKSIHYQKNKSVDMIRLNPQQWPDKAVTPNLFPPEDDYFTQLFAKQYREFLETNATTDERNAVCCKTLWC